MVKKTKKIDDDLRIVSRKDNEEIILGRDGEPEIVADDYAGNDDHQFNSGLESAGKLRFADDVGESPIQGNENKQQSLKDLDLGMED